MTLPNENTSSYEDYEFQDEETGGDEEVLDDDLGEDEEYEDDADGDDEDETEDAEGDGVEEAEDETEPEVETKEPTKFSDKQQKMVDKIVQARLDRKDAQFARQMSEVAGVPLESSEIAQSAKLWGLLKANPELSEAVDLVIQAQLKHGRATEPVSANMDKSRESALDLKEAVLDMKLADATFRKHSDKIMEWASDQGYEVTNAKALKLAVMAWKGSQTPIINKAKQASEQKRKDVKQATQKRAGVQSGANSKARTTPKDMRKLSDKDILSRGGLKLFTDD